MQKRLLSEVGKRTGGGGAAVSRRCSAPSQVLAAPSGLTLAGPSGTAQCSRRPTGPGGLSAACGGQRGPRAELLQVWLTTRPPRERQYPRSPSNLFLGLEESSRRLGLAAARGVWPKGRHGQRGLAILAFGRPGRRPTSARWTPPAGGDEAARAGLPPGTRGRYVCRRGPPRLPRSRRALPAPPPSRVQWPGAGAHGAAPRTGLLRAAARGSISPRPCLARLLICSRHRVLCSG